MILAARMHVMSQRYSIAPRVFTSHVLGRRSEATSLVHSTSIALCDFDSLICALLLNPGQSINRAVQSKSGRCGPSFLDYTEFSIKY